MPHEDERIGVLRLGLQRGARPALGVVDAAAREMRIDEGDERLSGESRRAVCASMSAAPSRFSRKRAKAGSACARGSSGPSVSARRNP